MSNTTVSSVSKTNLLKFKTCCSSICSTGDGIDSMKNAVQTYLRRREPSKMKWAVNELYKFSKFSNDFEKKISQAIMTNLRNRLIIMLDEEVLANGGIAALSAILMYLNPGEDWPAAALLGALAAANADTWATEIGSLAKGSPRLITNFRKAPTGSSGAISLPGTLAALAGGLTLGIMAFYRDMSIAGVISVTLGGLAGSLADSLLGATIQAQYRCPVCGKLTERLTHCEDEPTVLSRGFPVINNDAVNVIATLTGAIVSVFLNRLLS